MHLQPAQYRSSTPLVITGHHWSTKFQWMFFQTELSRLWLHPARSERRSLELASFRHFRTRLAICKPCWFLQVGGVLSLVRTQHSCDLLCVKGVHPCSSLFFLDTAPSCHFPALHFLVLGLFRPWAFSDLVEMVGSLSMSVWDSLPAALSPKLGLLEGEGAGGTEGGAPMKPSP